MERVMFISVIKTALIKFCVVISNNAYFYLKSSNQTPYRYASDIGVKCPGTVI